MAGQKWSCVKLLGGIISEKRGFLEDFSREAEGSAKNHSFYQIFRRDWEGVKSDFATSYSALGGGHLPPPLPRTPSLGGWGNTFENLANVEKCSNLKPPKYLVLKMSKKNHSTFDAAK